MNLRDGFSGDQALFLLISKAINNGSVLYRDVWDIKQPAIFVFYLIAGKLFGFTEVGIHLFELTYWFGFSLFLIFALRRYFNNALFAAFVPLLTIGIYYSVSGSLHVTQAESLVGFPVFLSLWFCQKFLDDPAKKQFIFLAGLFGGIVVAFKLLFILILIAMWACLGIYFLYFKRDAKSILVAAALLLLGFLTPVALVILYFVYHDALGELWYTTFIYPSVAVATVTMMSNRGETLINGLLWYLKSYFPVITLTLLFLPVSLWVLLKSKHRDSAFALHRENFLLVGLFIWAFSGFGLIIIQRLSWWEYHYSLLMIPTGILAVKCIESVYEILRSSTRFHRKARVYLCFSLSVLLLFIPTARRLGDRIHQFNNAETVNVGCKEVRITGGAVSDYRSIYADTKFFSAEDPRPPIFIVSNPLYYYLSDTAPVFSTNGAMSDMFTDVEWAKLDSELSAKPPKYIFVETKFIEPLSQAHPPFINTLNQHYSVYSTGERGSFYRRNE